MLNLTHKHTNDTILCFQYGATNSVTLIIVFGRILEFELDNHHSIIRRTYLTIDGKRSSLDHSTFWISFLLRPKISQKVKPPDSSKNHLENKKVKTFPSPTATKRGPTSKGRGRGVGREGREREGRGKGEEGRGGEEMGKEGGFGRTNKNTAATPLQKCLSCLTTLIFMTLQPLTDPGGGAIQPLTFCI